MTTYTITRAGFIMGRYHAEGATIELTDRQARLYLLEGRIKRPARAAQPRRGGGDPKKADAPKAAADSGDGPADA